MKRDLSRSTWPFCCTSVTPKTTKTEHWWHRRRCRRRTTTHVQTHLNKYRTARHSANRWFWMSRHFVIFSRSMCYSTHPWTYFNVEIKYRFSQVMSRVWRLARCSELIVWIFVPFRLFYFKLIEVTLGFKKALLFYKAFFPGDIQLHQFLGKKSYKFKFNYNGIYFYAIGRRQ